MTKNETKVLSKEEMIAKIEQLNADLNTAKTALKQTQTVELRSENTKNENNYHFSMSVFKSEIIANKEHEDIKKHIVSEDEKEIVVTKEFKNALCSKLKDLYAKEYNLFQTE